MDRAALEALARQEAVRVGLDPDLFVRQIMQESGFSPTARSPAGAVGLGQIMPDTARQPGYGVSPLAAEDLMSPEKNLRFSADYMSAMLNKFGDYPRALAAYNAGAGSVDKYNGVPPFKETQNYVRTILDGGEAVVTTGPIGEALMNNKSYDMFGDEYKTPEARNAAEELLLAAPNKQAANKSSVDGLTDSLAYLDLAGMSGGATRPADLGSRITPGRAGSGGRALKRLGIASLV
tara:strand:+ start:1166 stop:1870 length:705 start_codon:yes stop_codon:yes gene_type:complete